MGIFDCDTHCYETRDAFTKYMPKELLDRSIFPVRLPDGTETDPRRPACGGVQQRAGAGLRPAPTGPGSLKEMLKQMASGNPDETYEPMPMLPRVPGASGPDAAARASRASTGACCTRRPWRCRSSSTSSTRRSPVRQHPLVQPVVRRDVGLRRRAASRRPRCCRSATSTGRSPSSSTCSTGAHGSSCFPTGPAYGRSPGDPYFDPLWARIEEAGAVVAFHIMEHWYNEHLAPAWGHDPVPAPWHMSAWQWQNTYGERPIEDTLSALIFDNVFGRFPGLMVLASEFGAVVGAALRAATWTRAAGWAATARGSAARCASARARSSVVTCASRRTPRTTSPKIVERPRARRLDRDGLRLPARRGTRRPGRLRQAARPRSPTTTSTRSCGATRKRCSAPGERQAEDFRERVRAFPSHEQRSSTATRPTRRRGARTVARARTARAVAWPSEYGGGGLTKLEQVVLAEEFARAGCPTGAPQRQLRRSRWSATRCLRWGTEEQRRRFLAAHPLAATTAGARATPNRTPVPTSPALRTPGRARRRRVGDRRAEDLDVVAPPTRPGSSCSPAPIPTHAGTAASRSCCARWTSPASRCGRSRCSTDEREFSEVFFNGARTAREQRRRRGRRRLGRRDDAARRTSGARKRRPTRSSSATSSTASSRWRASTGATDDPVVRRPAGVVLHEGRDHALLGLPHPHAVPARRRARARRRRSPSSTGASTTSGSRTWRWRSWAPTASCRPGRARSRNVRTDDPGAPNSTASWTNVFLLNARGGTVYAGTSEIQRNILGETVLGLPKEPRRLTPE